MNDLISRAAIEWHNFLVADGNGMYHEEKVAYKSQIDTLPSAQPERTGRWIPCSERLPGIGKSVLVTDDGEEYFKEHGEGWTGQATTLAYMTEEGWEMCDINYDCQMNKITAWIPLPEPYREEGGE